MAGKKHSEVKTGRDERIRENRPLTPKQQHFARAVATGMTQSDAYREAYNSSPESKASGIWERASRLMANDKVRSRVNELMALKDAAVLADAVTDAELVRSNLRHWMAHGAPEDSVKVRAAELLGKASGLFQTDINVNDKRERTPEQVQAELERRLLALTSQIDEDGPGDSDTLQ